MASNDERNTARRALLRKQIDCFRTLAETTEQLAALEPALVVAEPALYGSRAPYPAPPHRSRKGDRGNRRWLREHGPELRAYGAKRSGGIAGCSVVWTISPDGLRAYDEAKRTERGEASDAPTPPPSSTTVVDMDSWIEKAGYRATAPRGGSR